MSERSQRYIRVRGFLGTYVVHDRETRKAVAFCYNTEDADQMVIAMNLLETYKQEVDT